MRGVEGAAGENDFFSGGGGFAGPCVAFFVAGVGFVDGFALQVFDACGFWLAAAGAGTGVEEDFCGERVLGEG